MALDINFGHTQMMQRELRAQQDSSVAEMFGGKRREQPVPRKLKSLQRLAEEGSDSKKHLHLEFSGRQLRLDGYWRDGSMGVTTLKRVGIVYNLENDTISVKVVADKARGIGDATILRSHLVPKPGTNDEYTWRDLGPVSRMWMERQGKAEGIVFAENEEFPPELKPRTAPADKHRASKRDDEGRRFMLARMGIVDRQLEDVAKFMQFDGQTLKFKCVWDDPSLGNEGLREFELEYFLVNDTVVVQEVGPRRDLDQKSALVKRQRIPKKFEWAAQDLRPLAPGSTDTIEYLGIDDIEVGATIDIYGRHMRVYDMDDKSRVLARSLLGREFAPATGAPPQIQTGATNAWGQPLKKQSAKSMSDSSEPWKGRSDVLSYTLKLLSRSKEDEPREFTMTLNVGTNEVSLAEIPHMELGIAGGKILAPVQIPFVKVESDFFTGPTRWHGVGAAPEMGSPGKVLGPSDCFVGARVNILGTKYKIIAADSATHSFMESYSSVFPQSHSDNLLLRLRGHAASVDREELFAAARGLDPAGSGVVSPPFFTQFLKFFNFELDEQEQHALARKFEAENGVELLKFIEAIKP